MQSWELVCFEGLAFGKALAIRNVALAGAVNAAAGACRSKDVGLVDFCHSRSVAPRHIAKPFWLMGLAPPCHISESTPVAYQLVELGG